MPKASCPLITAPTSYTPTRHRAGLKPARRLDPTTPKANSDSTLIGTKTEKQKENQRRIRNGLEVLAAKPPIAVKHTHSGYRTTGPCLAVGDTDILDAGHWYRLCIPISGKGPRCCFEWLMPRLSPDLVLRTELLASWWLIKNELKPKVQDHQASTTTSYGATGHPSLTKNNDSDTDMEFCDMPSTVRMKLDDRRHQKATDQEALIEISDSEDEGLSLGDVCAATSSVPVARNAEKMSTQLVRTSKSSDLDNNVVVTVMAWYSDVDSPSIEALCTRQGKCLVLTDHKLALGAIGLDGPVERYAESMRKWLALQWDTPVAVVDGRLVLLRARGVRHMIDWEDHTQHILDEGASRGMRASAHMAGPSSDFRSSSPPLLSSPTDRIRH